jgi:hypothetical protein
LQSLKVRDEIAPDLQSAFLQMLRFEHVQNCKSRGARHRITSKRAKEFHAVVKTGGDFWSGDDCGERKSVADWFSEYDDIGNDALRFESPKVRAKAAEADLHFVRNAYSACGANVFVSFNEIS